jgi:hypothetical protein
VKKVRFAALVVSVSILGTIPVATTPAIAASSYSRISGGNLEIIKPATKGKAAVVQATIFGRTSCPAYVFYGIRGSGEGYAYQDNKKDPYEVIAASGSIPERYTYVDDSKSSPLSFTDKRRVKRYQDGFGIGITLGRVFKKIKDSSRFLGKIASAAPAFGSAKNYQAPPVSALLESKKSARSYIASMFTTGIAATMDSLYYLSLACPSPKTRVILGGYSQGAFVASAAINFLRANPKDFRSSSVLRSVKSYVAVADPGARDIHGVPMGIVRFLKYLNGKNVTSGASSAISWANQWTPINISEIEDFRNAVNGVAGILSLASALDSPLGKTPLTAYANTGTSTPVSDSKTAVYSITRIGDIVGSGHAVLTGFLSKAERAGSFCLSIDKFQHCNPEISALVSTFDTGQKRHTSYSIDYGTGDYFAKMLSKESLLK